MSLAVGETHGKGVSEELLTPEGLNVFGDDLMGRTFDPFGVGNSLVAGSLSVGFTHG
jgi:hypothetical protein